ncbi:MAG: hypothetical protein WBG89_04260 [Ornithinimicrobium sp.]
MSVRASWAARILTVVLLAAAGGGLLWFVGSLPRDPVLAGAITVIISGILSVLWWSRSDMPAPAETASWYAVRRDHSAVPPALDYRLVRLRRDLRDALERSDREDLVHPLISTLARDRLLERHGVDLHTDPDEAAKHLTPALATYLSRPPTTTAKASFTQISGALSGIEEL